MCDYSLGGIPSRLATEGEELMLHRFPTDSIGLASISELQAVAPPARGFWNWLKKLFSPACAGPQARAVCIPPGAWLVLMNVPPDLQRRFRIGEDESVIFVQTSAEENTYRDALHFRDGRETLLQDLPEGLRLKVVWLGGDPVVEEEPVTAVPSGLY